ncbi:MAG TPA: response regulator, partial [Myxococcota bacterium]|nr:response regulator [Myxococcota bacterium]
MPKPLLVADDSKTMLQAVHMTLAGEDYQVHFATDGEAALGMARQLHPAVVLADYLMPKMDGYDLCRALKSDPGTARTPVVLLTGSSAPYDEGRGNACGVDAHLAKPWDSQALIDKIAEVIGRPARSAGAAVEAAAPSRAPSAPTAMDADGVDVDVTSESPFGVGGDSPFASPDASPFASPDPFAQAYGGGGGGASPFAGDSADPFAPPAEAGPAPAAAPPRPAPPRPAPAAAPPRAAPPAAVAAPPRPAPPAAPVVRAATAPPPRPAPA